MGDHLYILIID